MDSVSPIYQLLTRYRFHIFGLALIWIFFRHTSYYNQFTYGLLNPLVQIGDCGVDVFCFYRVLDYISVIRKHVILKNSMLSVFLGYCRVLLFLFYLSLL